jgi:mevalonate pyrophosphate decarboxylase
MAVQDEIVQEVQSKNKAKKLEREKVQNEMDDAMEALTIIDSAISSGYLLDKHSLILQEWAKEYQQDINRCKMFIQESDNE